MASYSKRGCRCEPCTTANREAMRAYNAKVKAETGRGSWAKYRTPKPPVCCAGCGKALKSWRTERPRCNACAGRRAVIPEDVRTTVYERAGWSCGICGGDVAQDTPYPDPMSPSLDHIIPVALGGTDDPPNLRLAHLRCNIVRGTSMAERVSHGCSQAP